MEGEGEEATLAGVEPPAPSGPRIVWYEFADPESGALYYFNGTQLLRGAGSGAPSPSAWGWKATGIVTAK